ncbi:MAG: hypothetical protein DDT19_01084 [Syntrophomonadaceae bacterium]|nr:hypothetical protein [Bacillota bacterium]
MALRRPIVLYDGHFGQLQAGDILDAEVVAIDTIILTNEELDAITIGTPVHISSASRVRRAIANAPVTAEVIGLVRSASIPSNGTGSIQLDGVLSMANWTSIIGAVTLIAGTEYYLSPTTAGRLTATPPTATGQFLVFVGRAISATDMDINIEKRILL